jgi:hypothetical protein
MCAPSRQLLKLPVRTRLNTRTTHHYMAKVSINMSARQWCSELSSGLYCRVKWLSTDVSEVRTASIIRDDRTASIIRDHPWWWRQYAPLKRRSTIILHGSTTQKTALNITLAAVRTWNLTQLDKLPEFLESEGSSPWQPATGPSSGPDESYPHPQTGFSLITNLNTGVSQSVVRVPPEVGWYFILRRFFQN